jgi:uncharacterized protein with HEPN domain
MQVELKSWAYDITKAIQEIEVFLVGIGFESYQNDLKTKRAIERNLEIIGEAMNRMLKKDPSLVFSDARKIVETRNRIIHGYDTVSDEIVWSIVTNNLQALKSELEVYLAG